MTFGGHDDGIGIDDFALLNKHAGRTLAALEERWTMLTNICRLAARVAVGHRL
jgi:hypothetical protein